MDQGAVFLTICGMAVVTYLPRLLPAWFLSSRRLSPAIVRFLGYVPAAVLSALLAPSLLMPEGTLDLGAGNYFLWAALPTFVLAWRAKSLFLAVALGMALVAAGRFFLGG